MGAIPGGVDVGIITSNGTTLEYRGGYNPHIVQTIKQIPGRLWHPDKRIWEFPTTLEVLELLNFPEVEITPEAMNALRRKREAEKMAQFIKTNAEKAVPKKPMPIKGGVKPFDHQVRGFNIGIMLSKAGLFMEQGCGKSLTAVAIAGRRYLDRQVKRVLVVAPLSVLPVWKREFAEYADFPSEVKILNGPLKKRIEMLKNFNADALQVAVINYEAVWRAEIFTAIKAWKPDMVIADESQRIANHAAKQSRGMHKLGDLVNYKLILTGTPITGNPLGFYSQYRFLDPDIFGKSFYAFRNRYAVMGGYQNKQVVGFQNKEELVRKAHSIAYRITKAEALDLPDMVDQELYCELEPSAARYYQEIVAYNVAELESGEQVTATNVLTKLLRLQQIAGGHAPEDETGRLARVSKAKETVLEETLKDLLDAGKKVVIFARFLPEIDVIRDIAGKLVGDGYRYITGAVPMDSRSRAVEEFQSDPSCRIFIAQIQTAGLGITLTAADTAIFYSMDFSYANYEQAKARIHRIGQENKVTYIHLLAQGTVDEKIYSVLREKKSIADDVVDNWKQYFTNRRGD